MPKFPWKSSFGLSMVLIGAAAALATPALGSQSRWRLDFENGAAFNGSNDIGIPGDMGTRFSLTRSFDVAPAYFLRMRLTYRLGRRSELSALYAPLLFKAEGTAPGPISFLAAVFPSGEALTAHYRFNSYRLTYRYALLDSERWKIWIGFTAKIRDAAIGLESASVRREKTNVGFVPLLYGRLEHVFSPRFSCLLEADALAAPQGRAEDVLLAASYRFSRGLALRAGYRFVEGGADNKTVYNFALIHYAVLGLLIDF